MTTEEESDYCDPRVEFFKDSVPCANCQTYLTLKPLRDSLPAEMSADGVTISRAPISIVKCPRCSSETHLDH